MCARNFVICILGVFLCLPLNNGIAQSGNQDREAIEYDRRLAETSKIALPSAGVVPDADTAKAVAMAIAIPVYGRNTVKSELPLRAGLKGNVWTVIGTFHPKSEGDTGGELVIQLDKRNGTVLSFFHTM